MAMQFKKAQRENIYVKVLLGGVAGAGKSYTALRLATGLARKTGGEGVAVIDTENGRIRYYANEFSFSDIQLEAPYTPEKYIEAIQAAVDAGFKVLVIDSTSHEWEYILDVHSKMNGNSYTNWAKLTPRDDAFQEKILQTPIHIISTVRGKTAYTMEDKNGKQAPKKVGVGFKQREAGDFQYTVVLNIDQETHIPNVEKDNTHLFEGRYDVLTEKDGENLYDWANSGDVDAVVKSATVTQQVKVAVTPSDEVTAKIAEISMLAKQLQDDGIGRTDISNAIKEYNLVNGKKTANFNVITDLSVAEEVLDALQCLIKTDEGE